MDLATANSPPRAEPDARDLAKGVAWRIEGRILHARSGTRLPDVCIFTGEPTRPEQRLQCALSWTPRWFTLAWIFATGLAVLSYGYFRKTGTLDFAVGGAGQKRRRWNLLFNLGISAAVVAMLLLAPLTERLDLALGVPFVPLLAFSIASARSRLFRVVTIDQHVMRIELTPPAAQALGRLA